MANSSEELLSPNTVHDPTATAAATATQDSAVIDQLDSTDDLAAQSSRDEQDLAEDGDSGGLKRAHDELIMAGGEYVLGLDDEHNAAKRQKLKEQAKKINNEQWDAMFERLVAYKQKHGVREALLLLLLCAYGKRSDDNSTSSHQIHCHSPLQIFRTVSSPNDMRRTLNCECCLFICFSLAILLLDW